MLQQDWRFHPGGINGAFSSQSLWMLDAQVLRCFAEAGEPYRKVINAVEGSGDWLVRYSTEMVSERDIGLGLGGGVIGGVLYL